ncbi:MarR family transcriptional regulator [Phreatobacter sp.]|uniref:MarR family winged helix-turn-helix transcriptional regulator n=1 Tax=Phreatobacter sp. TaxID=1966341 RepID=UPI0022BE1356|nr:MarR family transcriptional regulator [Phreatobacter sp.]MCZ8314038.1 MarR family transcriptional regulator [Phreatobacter sp.]
MTAKRAKATQETPQERPYVLEEQIGFLIRRAHQRASAIFEQVMDGFDVTPVQYAALAKLHDLGPTSQNQLGRMVGIDPATMFGVAGRLAKRGLVSPSVDPNDARLVLLSLTAAGREAVEGMKALGPVVTARTLEPLSEEEAATLIALLGRIG